MRAGQDLRKLRWGRASGGVAPRTYVAAADHSIRDQRAARADAAIRRLALSKCEAADALGVSVDFLEEHVMHELRVVRCGRRRLIPVAELQRWLDEHAYRVFEEPGAARGEHVHASPRRKR
jgi:excisionase family DNA binding protein